MLGVGDALLCESDRLMNMMERALLETLGEAVVLLLTAVLVGLAGGIDQDEGASHSI